MTDTLASLEQQGRLTPSVRELVEQSIAGFATIVVCSGTDESFEAFFPALGHTVGAQCHAVAIPPPPPAAVDYVRAALRQDPDAIVIDRRGGETLDMLLRARMTGHQVVMGTTAPDAETALAELRTALRGLFGEGQEAMVEGDLGGSPTVFVELSDEPGEPVAAVWQARLDGERARLVRLDEEGEALALPGPPAPMPEDFSEMAVPETWAPRQRPLLETLRDALGGRMRGAWAPRFGEEGAAGVSRFGGPPLLLFGEGWPSCGDCAAPLQLVAQLDLATLPSPAQALLGDEGVFQLFYCVSDRCDVHEAWAPFARNRLLRVLRGEALAPAAEVPQTREMSRFRSAPVVAWTPLTDSPGWEERGALGVTLADDEDAAASHTDALAEMLSGSPRAEGLRRRYGAFLEHWQVPDDEALAEILALLQTHPGDKLLGWPSWTQGVEYPTCPACAAPMAAFLQINNDGHEGGAPGFTSFFPQLFAGDGNGHVFACPSHRGELAFTWACG